MVSQKQSLDVMLDALKNCPRQETRPSQELSIAFFGAKKAKMQFEIDKEVWNGGAIIHGSGQEMKHAIFNTQQTSYLQWGGKINKNKGSSFEIFGISWRKRTLSSRLELKIE